MADRKQDKRRIRMDGANVPASPRWKNIQLTLAQYENNCKKTVTVDLEDFDRLVYLRDVLNCAIRWRVIEAQKAQGGK